jgi:hypothetical protein
MLLPARPTTTKRRKARDMTHPHKPYGAQEWQEKLTEREEVLSQIELALEEATTQEERDSLENQRKTALRLVNTAKTKLERLQAKEQAADEQILKQRLERKYLERMKEVGESAAALWAAQNALAKAQMRHEAALEALEPYDMEIATA